MKNIVLFTLMMIQFSCNYIPCSSSSDLSNVESIQAISEIAGRYYPDRFTREDFPEYLDADSAMLEIKADGGLSLHNFPVETFGSRVYGEEITFNATGTSQLGYKQNTSLLIVDLTRNGKRLSVPPFRIYRKADHYYILIDFGDPDLCTSVRLEQEK